MSIKKRPQYYLIYYPAVKTVLLFVFGLLLSKFLTISSTLLIGAIIGFLILILGFERVVHHQKESYSTIWITLILILFGLYWGEMNQEKNQNLHTYIKKLSLAFDTVDVSGKILQYKETTNGETLVVEIHSWKEKNGTENHLNSKSSQVQISFYKKNQWHHSPFYEGQTITVRAIPRVIQEIRNPNQFDYAQYLKKNGIHAQFIAIELVDHIEAKGLAKIKIKLIKAVEQLFRTEHLGIAKALLLGDKTGVDPETRLSFTRSGLAHLMAVSGLHVGFIVAPLWFLIPFVWATQIGRYVSIILLGLILLFYCWLTGFSPSVVRASIMAWLFSYGKLFEQIRRPMNIVAFSALALLIYNPDYLYDVGFQLSFGAVCIIILVYPAFYKLAKKTGRYRKLIASMLLGIVVQIGLAPLLAMYFGEISLLSPITNLFAVLPASALVLAGLMATFISILIPATIPFFKFILAWMVIALQWLAQYFGTAEWSYAQFSKPSVLFILIWISVLGSIAIWENKKFRWKWVIMSLSLILFAQLQRIDFSNNPKELEVTVLDVGQGDAIIISTPNGKHMLMDTGVWSPNYNSGSAIILPELKARGIHKLSALVLTHPHADHIGGTIPILQEIMVDTLYTDSLSVENKSRLYENILLVAQQKNIPIRPLFVGDKMGLDSMLHVSVLWPVKAFQANNINESSTVLRIDYGNTSFLFTGDIEDEAEELMSTYLNEVIDTDWLKVGHHGSRSSTHLPFLEDNTPKYAAVSLGLQNKYKHPHVESMIRLQKFNPKIHFTSLNGAGVWKSNGQRITKMEWKGIN